MSYETLDAIADAYIPLLLILFLIGLGIKQYRCWPHWRDTGVHFVFLLVLLVVSYGLMFVDKALGFWLTFGSDYSTHTAVALSLMFGLCALTPHLAKYTIVSMLAYVALMLYQQYHSVLDIISTATVISLFAVLFYRMSFRENKFQS